MMKPVSPIYHVPWIDRNIYSYIYTTASFCAEDSLPYFRFTSPRKKSKLLLSLCSCISRPVSRSCATKSP